MLPACEPQRIIVNLRKSPKALPMGVVVVPVTERELKRSVVNGSLVQRVVLERISGQWRVLIFLKGHTDGITLGLYRGGVRTFRRLEQAEAFAKKVMPLLSEETFDVFLRRFSEATETDQAGEPSASRQPEPSH